MKPILFSIILLVGYQIQVCACDCRDMKLEEARLLCYELYNQIIIVEIQSINDNSFEMLVLETLKGNISPDTILMGKSKHESCAITPQKYEIWLIYGNFDNNGNVIVDLCSLTRSFNKPTQVGIGIYSPLPPFQPHNKSHIDIEKEKLKLEKEAFLDLLEEIVILRKKNFSQ